MLRSFIFILLLAGLMAPVGISSDDEVYSSPGVNPSQSGNIQSNTPPASMAPGSLTTLYNGNIGSSGCMFDIDTKVALSELTAFDSSIEPSGVSTNIDIYWREGTCVGHTDDPYGWNLLGNYTATSAGKNNPTHFDVSGNGVSFDAGKIYGIYFHMYGYGSTSTLWYTYGGPNYYSNADLGLTTLYSKSCKNTMDPWAGTTSSPREWNGTIYYETGPAAPLSVNPADISEVTGGTVNFTLNAGANHGNSNYHILGSISGTNPGLQIPYGPHLPLNWDVVTDLVIKLANSPIFPDFRSTLDASGVGSAQFDTQGPLPPGTAGITFSFAYLLYEPATSTIYYASNPVDVEIVP